MDTPPDYTTNPWEDELQERDIDRDVSDPESHQQTPVQEPNPPTSAKTPKLRTQQRAPNQSRSQPTTTPHNPRHPSVNGLEAIWKSVHEKIDGLRQQVRSVETEVQRSQGLVHAVKRQVKDVNNTQIIERVDRDAWTGTTEIGGRLSLLKLEIDWILHDLAQGRPTPRDTPFPPRGRHSSRSSSPVIVKHSVGSEHISEDDSSPVSSRIRSLPKKRWTREAPSLSRGRNITRKSSDRRRARQDHDTDETTSSISSGRSRYRPIPSYSRKLKDGASVAPRRRQNFRVSPGRPQLRRKSSYVRRRPHQVEQQDKRYSDKTQEDEQPKRSTSNDSSATKINAPPPAPSLTGIQKLLQRQSRQENQGVGDQETGDYSGNKKGKHEKEVKRKLEEEAASLQIQLCAVQEKIRLETQGKPEEEEQDPTAGQTTICEHCHGIQSTKPTKDNNKRTDKIHSNDDDDSEGNANHTKTNTNGQFRARFKETAGQIRSILTHRKHSEAPDEVQWIKACFVSLDFH